MENGKIMKIRPKKFNKKLKYGNISTTMALEILAIQWSGSRLVWQLPCGQVAIH